MQTVCLLLLSVGLFTRFDALALLVQLLARGRRHLPVLAALLGWTVVMGPGPLFLDRVPQSSVDAIALPLALEGVSGRIDHLAADIGRKRLFVGELDDAVLDVIGMGWDGEAS